MKILYLGADSPSSTSRHRAEALKRLGHQVTILDPMVAIKPYCKGLLGAFHYRTGYAMLSGVIMRWLRDQLGNVSDHDLCWVDSGELLGPEALKLIKKNIKQLILFNHDDPSGHRDGARFRALRAAIPHYNLCVVVRPFNVPEFKALGAQAVLRVYMSYDEVAHAAPPADAPVDPQFDNDVAFIGRNMSGEGRDLLMLALIQSGLKVAIWGDNWQASKVWAQLKPSWRGGSLSGVSYVNAMRHAKICIGMLSKGNRDEHTTRTMEIPFAGGLLCAQRTPEHQQLYKENEEAVFWSSTQECVERCKHLLSHPDEIARIRNAGHRRVLANRVGNQDLCQAALSRLVELAAAQPTSSRIAS